MTYGIKARISPHCHYRKCSERKFTGKESNALHAGKPRLTTAILCKPEPELLNDVPWNLLWPVCVRRIKSSFAGVNV
jgi:hypothetical protein